MLTDKVYMHTRMHIKSALCGMIVDRSGWGLSWVRVHLWDKEFGGLEVGLGCGGQNSKVLKSSNFRLCLLKEDWVMMGLGCSETVC